MIDRKKVIKALEDAYVTDGVIKMSIQVRDVLVALLALDMGPYPS